ncbi:MAG TPA: hypothetical protein VN541_04925 [Tepidisphaeraceae bacterium]|nr:hypothetical protein [Tepidisphaeraceae bacterium]
MSQLASPEEAQRFVEKWSASDLSERAASHEHFIDLCRLLGQAAQTQPIYLQTRGFRHADKSAARHLGET